MRRNRWAFLEECVHAALVEKISRVSPTNSKDTVVLQYPLLDRLRDFYGDCSYDLSELEQLIEEVREIRQEFTRNQCMVTQLKMFEKACRDARNGNLNLYIFAD